MGGPHHRAGLGDLRDPGAGDAEVGDGGLALGVDDDVLRLQVAVDDAVAVGEAGGLQHLADHVTACSGVSPRVDQLLQRRPFDVLHGDVVGALELAAVEDGDDVRVLQAGRRLRLAAEALDELAVLGEGRCRTLSATRRCRCASSASQTSAIPPLPNRRSTLYRPSTTLPSSPQAQPLHPGQAENSVCQ